jgi:hypothetical protein
MYDFDALLVVKRYAARAGLDPGELAGDSLRTGLATSAAAAGVPSASLPIRPATRARRCFAGTSRESSLFRENAAGAVGL